MKTNFTGKSLQFLNKDNQGQAMADSYNRCYMTSADLENSAGGLSNYTGPGSGYIGVGDPFLSFAGDAGSFADATHKGKIYTIILTNANSSPRIAALCPGLLFETAVGTIADGAFNDTAGNAGLSGAGTPQALAYFNAYIRYFPTVVAGFRVSTANLIQFDNVITLQKQTPFMTEATRIINPAAYIDPINPNTSLVLVPETFYMDNQTWITYPVQGSSSVSLMLFFGASLNIANALYAKAETAQDNLTRMGATPAAGVSFRGRY